MTSPTPKPIKEKIPSGYSKTAINTYTPEMLELLNSLYSHLGKGSYLQKLAQGDEETFKQIEAPAFRQFNELQGGIASRFSGMGGLGARKSSGFQNTITAAGSSLAQDLQAQRQSLQQNAIKDLVGLSSQLLSNNPYEVGLVEKPLKWYEQAAIGAAQGFGQGAGQAAGAAATKSAAIPIPAGG